MLIFAGCIFEMWSRFVFGVFVLIDCLWGGVGFIDSSKCCCYVESVVGIWDVVLE